LTSTTLGISSIGQQTQLGQTLRVNRELACRRLVLPLAAPFPPFPASLLIHNIICRIALGVEWSNILSLGLALFAAWRYAGARRLVRCAQAR
jgi:hypothetical protein